MMRMRGLVAFMLLFLAGCSVPLPPSEGLSLTLLANPESIVPGGRTTLTLDLENLNEKTVKTIVADVFETGILQKRSCRKEVAELRPSQLETLQCELTAPAQLLADQQVFARVTYATSLHATQVVRVMSPQQYDLEQKKGTLSFDAKRASFRDKNMEVTLEFSREPPLLPLPENRIVTVSIRNIGTGLVNRLGAADIRIRSDLFAGGSCAAKELAPVGKDFPRISCEIAFPPDINFISDRVISIDIAYQYEVREHITVPVAK